MDPAENENHRTLEKDIQENGTSAVSSEFLNEASEYEKDGWVVGYAVELNGVGRSTVNQDDDSSSSDGFVSDADTEDEAKEGDSTDDADDKKGYLPLSAEPTDQTTAVLNSTNNGYSHPVETAPISHQPNDIQLDEDRISQIKTAMQGFQLPPMTSMPDDSKLLDLLKGLNTHNI